MKRTIKIAVCAAFALIAAMIIAAVVIVHTEWFRNYVRDRIVSSIENTTGGTVEVKSFAFTLRTLTATVTGLVIHGTEPAGEALFEAPRIIVRFYFPSFKKAIDIRYLEIDQPRANVIAFRDGRINLPERHPGAVSNGQGLEKLVNLAIDEVRVRDGAIKFLDRRYPFSVHGEDLAVEFAYNPAHDNYAGNISMNRLYLARAAGRPVIAKITVPVQIGKDAIQIKGAHIQSAESTIVANISLHDLTNPELSGQITAHIGLKDTSRLVSLPSYLSGPASPQQVDASVSGRYSSNAAYIQNASIQIGKTHITGSGELRGGATFRADISLDEIGTMFKSNQHPAGVIKITGIVRVPAKGPYSVTGNLVSNDVSLSSGRSRLQGIRLSSSFRADPQTVVADDLTIDALGGQIISNARLDHFKTFLLRSSLRNFAIRNLMAAVAPMHRFYAGSISGTVQADGALTFDSVNANAALSISPQRPGIPVSGRIRGTYRGREGILSLENSYIKLPGSRVNFTGQPGQQLNIEVTSRNLDDFFPAVEILAPATTAIPVDLRPGGTSRLVVTARGPIVDPRLSGSFRMTRFAAGGREFDRLAADFQASHAGAALQNGVLTGRGSQANFAMSFGLTGWHFNNRQPLNVNATVLNGDLGGILALAGQAHLPISGKLDAELSVSGTFGNPQGSGQIAISNGAAYGQSIEKLTTAIDLSDQRINLSSLHIETRSSALEMTADFVHPRDDLENGRLQARLVSSHIQLADFKYLQGKWPGSSGTIVARGDIVGQLKYSQGIHFTPSVIDVNVNASGIQDRQHTYGGFTVSAATYGSDVIARVNSDLAGSSIQLASRTQLAPGYPSVVDASIRNLPIGGILSIVMPNPRVTGTLTAKISAKGTLKNPQGNFTFDLRDGNIYDEPVERLTGEVGYTDRLITISSLRAEAPAGNLELHGSLSHAPSDFRSARVNINASIPALDLRKIRNLQLFRPGLGGSVHLTGALSADLARHDGGISLLPSNVAVHGEIDQIAVDRNILGTLNVNGETRGQTFSVNVDSTLAGSSVRGSGRVQLTTGYPTNGAVTFTNLGYAGFRDFLPSKVPLPLDFSAMLDGQAVFSGPLAQPGNLQAQLRLSKALVSSQNISLRNRNPLIARLDHSTLHIENAQLEGPSINVAVNGSVALRKSGPVDLSVNASTDLSLVKTFYKDAFANGSIAIQSTIQGTLAQPLVNGQIVLKNASVQLTSWPNGIFNANGVVALNGSTARIQSITAESGGGHVVLDGFVSITGNTLNYDVRANAQKVRTRYSGASITADAVVTLTGTSKQSVLGGTVTIDRVGYSQQSDIGSILSASSTLPRATQAAPGGMRLNLRVETAPDVRFQTNLAQELSGSAALNVYGTPTSPGIVGRVTITGGSLIFFGNKYTVNRGTISFFDPAEIAPVLDIDLQTLVQGVEVNLGVAGPIQNLKLTYRSDPPLKFEDIVALLATGKTPPDPTIAVNQPFVPNQSAAQMGESALLAQAVANPLAGRLERVFGVSQIKIAPTFASGSSLPQARVTIQQQVSGGITLTYSQDLAEANSELIQIEWALTPRFSAVATRDENGIFGVDFYYKKQFR